MSPEKQRLRDFIVKRYSYQDVLDNRVKRPKWAQEDDFDSLVNRNSIGKSSSLSTLVWKFGVKEGNKRFNKASKNRSESLTLKAYTRREGKEEGTRKYKEHLYKNSIKGTLLSYTLKYGDKVGLQKYEEKNSNLSVGIDRLTAKYGKKKALEIKGRHSKNSARTLDNFAEKHGALEGSLKYYVKCSQTRLPSQVEFYTDKGYSKEEAERLAIDHQSKTLDKFIEKYGEKAGKVKYKKYCYNKSHSLKRYQEKYGKEDGLDLHQDWKDAQKGKGTLEYCIERYGKKEGEEFYKQTCDKKSLVKENFIRKYGKEEGEKRYKKYSKSTRGTSFNERDLAKELKKLFPKLDILNGESGYTVYLPKKYEKALDKKWLHPDITLLDSKQVVEYYGDLFHAAPKFKSLSKPNPWLDKTAKEIRVEDKRRVKVLQKLGYTVHIVWEHEWKDNRKNVLKQLKETINEVIKNTRTRTK